MHLLVRAGDHATVNVTSGILIGGPGKGLVGANCGRFMERTTKLCPCKGNNRMLQIGCCESVLTPGAHLEVDIRTRIESQFLHHNDF